MPNKQKTRLPHTAYTGMYWLGEHHLPLYDAENVRALDQTLTKHYKIPGLTLMRQAGKFAFDQLLARWPGSERLIILCGSGNNAGDGYIIAQLAVQSGLEVQVYTLAPPEKLKGDALAAYQLALAENISIQPFDPSMGTINVSNETVIVDAMLGTGLTSEVRESYAQAIRWCHDTGAPLLAVDIPSGLCANTGQALGTAISADITTTFIGLKIGLLTGRGRNFSGHIAFDDLNTPASAMRHVQSQARCLSLPALMRSIKRRPADAHKGHFGHVLIIAGNDGFAGAAMLSALACTRAGAGLTSVATRPQHCAPLIAGCPEVMTKGVEHLNDIQPLLETASTIVIGPGLGQDAWAEQMLYGALQANRPMVIDADALNLVSKQSKWRPPEGQPLIITPHPGEAARLLGCTTADIASDRLAAARKLSKQYRATTILKGSGTLICHPDQTIDLCPYGNPGMATGGMGDVLSGLLGGLLAQTEFDTDNAARLAVCLHARAADLLSDAEGERGLLASDLIPVVRQILNRKIS